MAIIRIIAVDPGPKESAVLQWDGEGVINPRILTNDALRSWFLDFETDGWTIAIEMIACYGMPVGAETFETCLFIGRLQEIAGVKELPCQLVYRRDVKRHICNNIFAGDPNVRQALIDRFGPPGTKKNPGRLYGVHKHLWSALAVAITVQAG